MSRRARRSGAKTAAPEPRTGTEPTTTTDGPPPEPAATGDGPTTPATGGQPGRADGSPTPEGGPPEKPGTGRAAWHRRAALLPLAYLAALVVVGIAHPFLPSWRWLAVHLLLLGAASNAILVWSAHFTAAVLRVPPPPHRRGEVLRLAVLNVGTVAVLVGATVPTLGPVPGPWLGVAGAAAVAGAVGAHLWWLVAQVRAALPAPYAVTVHYYLAAAGALLVGVPVGAWMLVDSAARPRLLLLHVHVNLLGWIALTVLGTLLTLWPTVLRTRMAPDAVTAANRALPVAVAGLALLGAAVLGWWPALAVGGLALFVVAVALVAVPAVRAARGRPPASFAAWSIAAAAAWLLVALAVDAVVLATAGDPGTAVDRSGLMLVPLLVGFVGQVLVGSLAYLLPTVLGGGPARVRHHTAIMDRHWPQRVTMANAALAVFTLPVPPYVRITTSLLVLAALVQFLVTAVHLLVSARRTS